jgi:hypothetical protein
MTYAYTGAKNAQVDLFEIASPDYQDADPGIIATEESDLVTGRPERRFEQLTFIRPRAVRRVSEIAGQLYETAPQDAPGAPRSVYGRNVRGSWATADLVAPSRLRFFLGLLAQPLTAEQAGAPRRRRSAIGQNDAEEVQVAATGRIIIAVARDAGEDPDWSEVASRLQ